MNFKAYDILASLVPGFLSLIIVLNIFSISYDKDLILVYTTIAFLFGYIVNAISSLMEDIYFFTWKGKPSSKLLDGKDIWKVRFYHGAKAKALLQEDAGSANAKNNELFSIAMRYANGQKDARVEDLNAIFAFSRSLLTVVLIGSAILFVEHYKEWKYYAVLLPTIVVMWLRCKQLAYYYAREVLNVYLKIKLPI